MNNSYNNPWEGYIPEDVDQEEFFAFIAGVYPGVDENGIKKDYNFRVAILECEEGSVPHVHVFYRDGISHICLGTNEYAPQHANETKILSPKETEVLKTFFSSMIDTYRKDDNGNIYQLNAWMDAVFRWLKQNPAAKKFFKFDNNGIPIMPDYSTIKMPSKENRKEFEGMKFRY